ncbi:MAG: sigma 54-interacting transcriptional regulator [bacterium]
MEKNHARCDQEIRLLNEIVVAITKGKTLKDLVKLIYGKLGNRIPHNRISVGLLDPEGKTLTIVACRCDGEIYLPSGYRYPIAGSSLENLVFGGKSRILNDLEEYLANKPESEPTCLIVKEGMRSSLTVPLLIEGKPTGVMFFSSREKNTYREEHVTLLQYIASHLAIALEKAQMLEELQKLNELKTEFVQRLQAEVAARTAELEALKEKLMEENIYLKDELSTEKSFYDIIGNSPLLNQVIGQVKRVAPTDTTVLIRGETGTGKEMIARTLHKLSSRRDQVFVKVNCSALTETLIASELFGHEKGSFTGAIARKVGRFELANGGTIFLDEIGELSLDIQVKILRVLQEREFERVGGNQPIKINVRVITATNRDLEKAIAEGKFRSDLFYRLNVFPIFLPPLRDRLEDIEDLTWYFIRKYSKKMNKNFEAISKKTIDLFKRYPWPGNIRELENVVERGMILIDGPIFSVDSKYLMAGKLSPLDSLEGFHSSFSDASRRHILDILKKTQGKIYGDDGAAKLLQLKPTTLISKMKRLGIQQKKDYN